MMMTMQNADAYGDDVDDDHAYDDDHADDDDDDDDCVYGRGPRALMPVARVTMDVSSP